ncbi:poly-gamma-glutamate synthase PgsB [Rhodopirellula sp. JC740]|uniref:Poly-gamma-glutamate synthase PgsB n=1 Tax=Rhodopirellula halodulae TaxID=2894198 RepID=A0ABS8NHP0_9BACT|nr:poly-gamma-glutamate synthase PgsB [Rhodopirellula sp. JC740]MCC9643077.1 poly-gamma-glutamate synthase PgsB [Rhodopirellula sp. JC740]
MKDPFVNGTLALVAFAASVCAAAMVEAYWYRRQLLKIPFRIHVNGTRGKSSVTRLIAAGLRSGGIRTCAKTTGTLARMILPDGKELPIFRPDRANVIEQKRIVQTAVGHQAEALVIECMALQPLLQSVCELKLVRSTHGVITNARADHLDVMGPTRLDVARALSATTPIGGIMFTAEDRADSLSVMKNACEDRGSSLSVTTSGDAGNVTQDELAQFSYLEHAENVALALKVCQSMGVDREVALQGMWEAQPDPGAMRVHTQNVHGKQWHFVNAFAANDPESTTRIWDAAYNYFPGANQRVLIMNCRVDRADRSTTMAEAVATWAPADRYVIIGSGTDIFLRRLLKRGVHPDKVLCLGNASGTELVESVLESFRREERLAHTGGPHFGVGTAVAESNGENETSALMLMGIGNVAGPGMALADHFGQDQGWERFREPVTRPARVLEMV